MGDPAVLAVGIGDALKIPSRVNAVFTVETTGSYSSLFVSGIREQSQRPPGEQSSTPWETARTDEAGSDQTVELAADSRHVVALVWDVCRPRVRVPTMPKPFRKGNRCMLFYNVYLNDGS
jgi:hypothetical protein